MSDNGKDWWAPFRVGLFTDIKHRKQMGSALWLYAYLHLYADRTEGRLIRKYETIARHMGVSVPGVKKWMRRLVNWEYVETTRTGNGISIKITKFRSIKANGRIQTGISNNHARSTHLGTERYPIRN